MLMKEPGVFLDLGVPNLARVLEAMLAAGVALECLQDPEIFRELSEAAREDAGLRHDLDRLRGMLAAILD